MFEDVKEVQEQFNKVLLYSQEEYYGINTDSLFEDWKKNKEKFITAFDGKYIYELPEKVTFELSKEEKDNVLQKFIEKVANKWSEDIANFLREEKDGIFVNKVIADYTYNGESIPTGMKIGKALTQFFKDTISEYTFDKLIQEFAEVIQSNKISGKLCVSVHPLDFLSLSENSSNWRSCHALNGEYRAGNLTYMADDCTFIVYLKSDKDVELPRFPEDVLWNNKKWRCLMFFDSVHNMIWAGRQYPFFSMNALNIVLNKVLRPMKYFSDNYYFHGFLTETWEHKIIKDFEKDGTNLSTKFPYIYVRGELISLNDLIEDDINSLHYNDLLNSTVYTPYYVNFEVFRKVQNKKFKIGNKCNCIRCGKRPIFLSEAMYCKNCILDSNAESEEITTCAECGDRIFVEDSNYWRNGYYCDECLENLGLKVCSCCGSIFSEDEVITKDEGFTYYCYSCYHDIEED